MNKKMCVWCVNCGVEKHITVKQEGWNNFWYNDVPMRQAMPELSQSQIRLLSDNICPTCDTIVYSEQ